MLDCIKLPSEKNIFSKGCEHLFLKNMNYFERNFLIQIKESYD